MRAIILRMIDVIQKALHEWSNTTDGREKLQHTYIVAAITLVLAAGIIGLINYDLGQKLLFVAILAVAMFFINAVAWALLQSFILLKLGTDKAAEKIAPAAITKAVKKAPKKKTTK